MHTEEPIESLKHDDVSDWIHSKKMQQICNCIKKHNTKSFGVTKCVMD